MSEGCPFSHTRRIENPHRGATRRDVFRAESEQRPPRRLRPGAAVGVTGAASDAATPEGATQDGDCLREVASARRRATAALALDDEQERRSRLAASAETGSHQRAARPAAHYSLGRGSRAARCAGSASRSECETRPRLPPYDRGSTFAGVLTAAPETPGFTRKGQRHTARRTTASRPERQSGRRGPRHLLPPEEERDVAPARFQSWRGR
jgi:hypothetical protein